MSFWDGKKVAITGANGFVGSSLVERLVGGGAEVTVLLRRGSVVGLRSIRKVADKVKIVYGDVRQIKSLDGFVSGKDVVFHLAAITQVAYAVGRPGDTFGVNAIGTLNMLESMRKNGDGSFFVYMSTDKVYGEALGRVIDENCSMAPKSPYDAAKIAADRLTAAYFATYGLDGAIARSTNIIGARDSNHLRIVPDFVASVLSGKELVIRGGGRHMRDYIYMSDALDGLAAICEKRQKSNRDVFNIGTGISTSTINLVRLMIRVGGKKPRCRIIPQRLTGEICKQVISNSKMRKRLGWKPRVSLEEGIRMTLDWYYKNLDWQEIVERKRGWYKSQGLAD